MTPLQQAAYDIGAKGSEPTEAERLAFESWMRGHCWAVIGEWDGKQYKHAHESTGFVHGGAMETRRLWAAWRDRGAVARVLAEQAQTVEKPVAWWIPKAEQFCLPPLLGERPFAKAWEPLYTHPTQSPAQSVTETLAAHGVKLRTEFEPKPRDHVEDALAMVGKAQQVAVPYDQQALELCPACGWKAIIPGEPCLNCGRGEVMKALDAYAAERDALMADGARYQFMKSCSRAAGLDISGWHSWTCQIMRSDIKGATLDQAIDAAIKKAGAETKTDWSAA